MKKLIYGAMLAVLAVPALQSCIDDKESASVTAVRDAKAKQLQAVADYNAALAATEAINAQIAQQKAAADIAIAEAQAEYLQAQAAYQQAYADYQAALAEGQAQENAQALAMAEVELAKKKAEAAQAQAYAEYQQAQYENELINQQIENIKKQQELADAETSAQTEKINALMTAYQTAAGQLNTARGAVSSAQSTLTGLQNGLNDDEYQLRSLQNSLKQNENLLAQLQAQLSTIEEYADYTPESLTEAINEKFVEVKEANAAYQTAYDAYEEAYSVAYTPDGTPVMTSAYYLIGENENTYYQAINNFVDAVNSLGVDGIFLTLTGMGDDPKGAQPTVTNNGTTYTTTVAKTFGWWQPAAKEGDDPTYVALFNTKQSQVVSYESINPGIPVDANPVNYDYEQWVDYYTYSATGITSLINYLTGLNAAYEKEQTEANGGKLPDDFEPLYDLTPVTENYADIQGYAKDVTGLVSQYNTQAMNLAVTQFNKDEAYEAYNLVLTEYNEMLTIQSNINSNYNSGNSDAEAIAELRGRIQSMETSIMSLQNQIDAIANNTADKEAQIAAAEDALAAAQEELAYAQGIYDNAKAALDAALAEAKDDAESDM